ncbi:oxidoreductase, partial [Streptomyces galilaeus]
RALARAGASVTVGARDPDLAMAALAGVAQVLVERLDLVDPSSIDAFAGGWMKSGRSLHMLINGAAASGGPERDARGYE